MFHLFILPSILKVILITIFTDQPNCVIKVRKKFKPKVQSWFLKCTFLATKEGGRWVYFLLLYSLWFHFVSSCNPAICHKSHKFKLSDVRYGNKRSGVATQPPSWPEVFSIQVRKISSGKSLTVTRGERMLVLRSSVPSSFQAQSLSTSGEPRDFRQPGRSVGHPARGKEEEVVGRQQALTS